MAYLGEIQRINDGLVKKFRRAGALDRKHAVPLETLRLTTEEKTVGMRYLRGCMALRRTKGQYYLIVKRLKNPMVGYALRALLIFAVVIPAVFALMFLFSWIYSLLA